MNMTASTLVVMLLIGASQACAQDSRSDDEAPRRARSSVELRAGIGSSLYGSGELHLRLGRRFTAGAILWGGPDIWGAHATGTWWGTAGTGVQASAGYLIPFVHGDDTSGFMPDYSFGLAGALRLPIGGTYSRWFITAVLGPMLFVQPDFCFDCRGIAAHEGFYMRIYGRLELGAGLVF